MEQFTLFVLLMIGMWIYFMPSVISTIRIHHKGREIFEFNLCLGWTVLGWITAFVWACTPVQRPVRIFQDRSSSLMPRKPSRSANEVRIIPRERSNGGWVLLVLFIAFNTFMFSGCMAFVLFWLAAHWGLLDFALAQNQRAITFADSPFSIGTVLLVWACGSVILGLAAEAKR